MKSQQAEILELGRASGLKGLVVVARKEGKLLGKVSHVFISPDEKKLSGIVTKDEFWSKDRQHIPMTEIESIGEDVVFIKSEKSCKEVTDIDHLPGLSIKDLQGHWVTTQDGKHLGQFLDVNFSSGNWMISELLMSDDKTLQVDPSETIIGADEILVPTSYLSKVEHLKKRKSGILSRVFGEETADQVSQAVSRGAKSAPAPTQKPKPETEQHAQAQ